METTIIYWGNIKVKGIYWGYIGIMEKKMETTIIYLGNIKVKGIYWGLGASRDQGF